MSNADPRGKFVWHELLTADKAGAEAFYPKIVSWKSQAWVENPEYTMWLASGSPVGGAMSLTDDAPDGAAAHWMTYIGVEDLDATLAQAKSMGAKVVKDVTELPTGSTYAVLADPQGAEFGILKSAHEYKGEPGGLGAFSWHELSTSDADAAIGFYSKLFGWEVGHKHDMGPMGFYHLFNDDAGKQYGGVFKSPQGDPPAWVLYIRVPDIDKAVAAVKAGGGRVLNGPMEVPGGSWVAQVMDAEGVMFAVHDDKAVTAAQSAPAEKPAAAEPKAPKPPKASKPKAPKPAAPAAQDDSSSDELQSESAPVSKPAAPAKAKPAAAVKPAAAPAAPAAAKPAAVSAPKPKAKAKKKAAPAPQPAAKKAASKTAGKSAAKATGKTSGKKVVAKAAKKAGKKAGKKVASKVAKKAPGKKASARKAPAKKAPAKKKAAPAKRPAAKKAKKRR